jgi:hypothetical protein
MFPGPEHGEVIPTQPQRNAAPPPPPNHILTVLKSLSWKAWVAFALVLVGIGFLVSFTGKSAKLHLVCQHNLRNGELRVWAGDQLVYVGKLTTSTKKRFGFLPPKNASGFSQTVKAPDGHYDLRVQVLGDNYDQSRSIPVDLAGDTEATVTISAYSRNLQVSWRDTRFAPIAADTPWYVKYAKALLITIVGSIISAMMGIVVREIIEKLRHPKPQSAIGTH